MGFVLHCLARATQSTLERSPDRARAVYAPLEKPVSRAVVQRSGQFVLLSRSKRCDVVYTPKRRILSPSRYFCMRYLTLVKSQLYRLDKHQWE